MKKLCSVIEMSGSLGCNQTVLLQVQLAVFRFPDRRTDILISMNTPMHINSCSAAAQHTRSGPVTAHLVAPELFLKMLTTFSIVDYSLFGG